MHWRRKWQPTPVFLPGVSQGRGRLVGCHLWGRTESETTAIDYIYVYAAAAAKSLVMSDSVRPYRWQPTRLRHPWDSPSKNTGVGCHFLLQCMQVKSESEVAQSCPTLSDPMDCSLSGSSIHGIFHARVLEWGAIAFSKSLPLGGDK